ncbi:hypothetical protein HLRTI_000865 [Halorhabdus tiamatea SARL4B]|uniref:Uncharacterized protein n=1 Tax=Halorhabdus tiamatea SARL4B TaxID=1033806 RepID=F7PKE2_9EURY|nr:DUF5804 family protein [Halorhabdus tiamatea]ERJ07012.1 hypothetical protein HLRTI_000865 [Halorhabdus tiamatea SARL4B]CCQ34782.1 conserved hypothetical protein [Halorhabdus tiamatea SARL4B]
MTRVCLLGNDDVPLRQTLLGHETARHALATYELAEPFHNAIELETVSLGAAVSLLNDLNWYLVRYVDTVLVHEPSISEAEWLSRDLATAIRDGEIEPEASGRYLKVYGVEQPAESPATTDASDEVPDEGEGGRQHTDATAPRLVEPMYVTRTGGSMPEYDLRTVEETVVLRVTQRAFSR